MMESVSPLFTSTPLGVCISFKALNLTLETTLSHVRPYFKPNGRKETNQKSETLKVISLCLVFAYMYS